MSTLVLFSHPAVDLFVGDGGVKLFYPFSQEAYLFNFITIPVTINTGFIASAISSEGIGLTIFVLFIFAIIFVEDFVKTLTRSRSPEKALKKTIKMEEKKIEREI